MPTPTLQPDLDQRPIVELLKIAIPSIATMTSYSAMQFVDTLMVSRITPADPIYVAAAGNGGVWAWMPMAIAMGITGMVNTFVSQHLGAGEPRKGSAYAWNAVWVALIWSICLLPYALLLPTIFRWQGHDTNLIALSSQYGQILLYGSFLTLAARALAQYFYGLHRPWIVLLAALAGNITNIACNYLLIFGNERLGIPALGVPGAALGTVIGAFVELLIPAVLFLSGPFNREFGTRSAWRFSRAHAAGLFKTGWSPALMYGNEMICWAIFMSALVGSFGVNHNAASWITLRYMHTSFMPAVGISFAITAVVGKAMGAGRPDLAAQRAWTGVKLAMVYMSFCAILMAVFREQAVGLFIQQGTNPADVVEILRIGSTIMIVAACFQVFDALGISLVGALRGAGDTVVPGVVTMVLSWTLIIGLGITIMRVAPGLGAIGPWIAAAVYIIVFGIWAGGRFWRGKWKSIRLIGEQGGVNP